MRRSGRPFAHPEANVTTPSFLVQIPRSLPRRNAVGSTSTSVPAIWSSIYDTCRKPAGPWCDAGPRVLPDHQSKSNITFSFGDRTSHAMEPTMESFVHLRRGRTARRLHADLDGLKDDELGRGGVTGRTTNMYRRHDFANAG